MMTCFTNLVVIHQRWEVLSLKSVIKFEKHVYSMENLDATQIAVGLGSTQLAMDLLEVILDPGDNILLLDPSYCNYPTQIITNILDANILRFPILDDNTWEDLSDSKINEFHEFILENNPKMILLISPDNPTSKVLSHRFVAAALEAAIEIGSFLVIDYVTRNCLW